MICACGKPANCHYVNKDVDPPTDDHYCDDCFLVATKGTPAEDMVLKSVMDGRAFTTWWGDLPAGERARSPQAMAHAGYMFGLARGREVKTFDSLNAAIPRRCPQCNEPVLPGQRFCGAGCSARHEAHEPPAFKAPYRGCSSDSRVAGGYRTSRPA